MTETETLGLRERKKRETRKAIHDAALDLVEAHGFDSVTTESIAAAAGVSPRTFFNYFPSKEAAVIGTGSEDLEERVAELEGRPAEETPLVALRHVLDHLYSPSSLSPAARVRRRRILLGEPALAGALVANNMRVEHALTEALERRLGLRHGASIAPRVTVAAAIGAVRACLEHQQRGGPGRLDSNIDAAFAQLGSGLS